VGDESRVDGRRVARRAWKAEEIEERRAEMESRPEEGGTEDDNTAEPEAESEASADDKHDSTPTKIAKHSSRDKKTIMGMVSACRKVTAAAWRDLAENGLPWNVFQYEDDEKRRKKRR
jgi:hypothetical protein